MAWHGNCYKKRNTDVYPKAELDIGEDADVDPREALMYTTARNGDHLITPFQCDVCHFRNLYLREPMIDSVTDVNALVAIRRANIDAFWSRSPGTINNTRNGSKRILEIGLNHFGLANILPDMGPHPLRDDWGMGLAIVMLQKSLDKGRYKATVQFETVRKLRAAFSNVWGSSEHCMTKGVMARDMMKTFVTNCPSHCLWFERFIKGMHCRMGDDRRPDLALSRDVMLLMMEMMDRDYQSSRLELRKRYIARAGVFFLSTYLGGLRGEEVPRMIRKYFILLNMEAFNHKTPHCVLPLYGRFKSEGGIARCFMMRVVCKSKHGLNMRLWVERVIEHEKSSTSLYLFTDAQGRKESPSYTYESYLFSLLREIQDKRRELIPAIIDVEDAYGISRSGRRGGTTGAQNAPNSECSKEDIERNNRWRKLDTAGTRQPGMSMIQLYTDTLHALEADLRFSSCQ